MDILQELQNRILFCDGGMGSLLQEAGLKPGTFLLELLELRLFIHSVKMKAEEKQSEIYRLHDKMQDEKNLLITE